MLVALCLRRQTTSNFHLAEGEQYHALIQVELLKIPSKEFRAFRNGCENEKLVAQDVAGK